MAPPRDPSLADYPVDSREFTKLFEDAFETLEKAAKRAVKEFGKFLDAVNEKLNSWSAYFQLDDATVKTIKDKLAKIEKALLKLLLKMKRALEHHTPVVSLIYAAYSWIENVMSPVSNMRGEMGKPENENLRHWKADAQRAYDDKKADQQAAVKNATEKAKFVGLWLMDIAKENVDYVMTMAKHLTKYASRLVEAGIEAASVVGLLEAVGTVASIIGDLLTTAMEMLGKHLERICGALSGRLRLHAERLDYSVFTDGKWPQAVT